MWKQRLAAAKDFLHGIIHHGANVRELNSRLQATKQQVEQLENKVKELNKIKPNKRVEWLSLGVTGLAAFFAFQQYIDYRAFELRKDIEAAYVQWIKIAEDEGEIMQVSNAPNASVASANRVIRKNLASFPKQANSDNTTFLTKLRASKTFVRTVFDAEQYMDFFKSWLPPFWWLSIMTNGGLYSLHKGLMSPFLARAENAMWFSLAGEAAQNWLSCVLFGPFPPDRSPEPTAAELQVHLEINKDFVLTIDDIFYQAATKTWKRTFLKQKIPDNVKEFDDDVEYLNTFRKLWQKYQTKEQVERNALLYGQDYTPPCSTLERSCFGVIEIDGRFTKDEASGKWVHVEGTGLPRHIHRALLISSDDLAKVLKPKKSEDVKQAQA